MKRDFTVRRGALDGVEAFLAVAKHLSFRKAAGDLGVRPSAIGQAVRTLEARIGAALFTRTTRSVGLTQAGERLRARVGPAFAELVAAAAAARQLGEHPEGLLRLTVPRAVVGPILQPVVAGFCRAYPDIELEISVGEQLVDIVSGGFDAGIRIGNLLDADMVKVRLTPRFGSSWSAARRTSRGTAVPRHQTVYASTRACACAARTVPRALATP